LAGNPVPNTGRCQARARARQLLTEGDSSVLENQEAREIVLGAEEKPEGDTTAI